MSLGRKLFCVTILNIGCVIATAVVGHYGINSLDTNQDSLLYTSEQTSKKTSGQNVLVVNSKDSSTFLKRPAEIIPLDDTELDNWNYQPSTH